MVVEETIFRLSPSTEEYKKRIEDYIHLMTMIHSKNCEDSDCKVPKCKKMLNLLKHIPNCSMGAHCMIPDCYSSREILTQAGVEISPPKSIEPKESIKSEPPGGENKKKVHDLQKEIIPCEWEQNKEISFLTKHMIHAVKCSQSECEQMDCGTFKKLLSHLPECHETKCDKTYCCVVKSLLGPTNKIRAFILNHLRDCTDNNCLFCPNKE